MYIFYVYSVPFLTCHIFSSSLFSPGEFLQPKKDTERIPNSHKPVDPTNTNLPIPSISVQDSEVEVTTLDTNDLQNVLSLDNKPGVRAAFQNPKKQNFDV